MPDGNLSKMKCQKCDLGCNLCYSRNDFDLSYWTSCDDGYKIYNGNCTKNCETRENKKCKDSKLKMEQMSNA